MPDTPVLPEGVRTKRIKKLLDELSYEIHRGLIDGDVTEALSYTFIFPDFGAYPGFNWHGAFYLSRRSSPFLGHLTGDRQLISLPISSSTIGIGDPLPSDLLEKSAF